MHSSRFVTGSLDSKGACDHVPLPIEFVGNWPRALLISLLH
jgi:hypothetical protein